MKILALLFAWIGAAIAMVSLVFKDAAAFAVDTAAAFYKPIVAALMATGMVLGVAACDGVTVNVHEAEGKGGAEGSGGGAGVGTDGDGGSPGNS